MRSGWSSGVEDGRFVKDRPGDVGGVGSDDGAAPLQEQVAVLAGNRFQKLDRLARWLVQRMDPVEDIGPAQNSARGQDKALALEGIVPAGKLVEVPDGRPLGHVNRLMLGVHGCPGQGHPVLPADQCPQVAILGAHHSQRAAVSPPPDQALGVGRNQLAVDLEARARPGRCR